MKTHHEVLSEFWRACRVSITSTEFARDIEMALDRKDG
jgi:hypothetical protein